MSLIRTVGVFVLWAAFMVVAAGFVSGCAPAVGRYVLEGCPGAAFCLVFDNVTGRVEVRPFPFIPGVPPQGVVPQHAPYDGAKESI